VVRRRPIPRCGTRMSLGAWIQRAQSREVPRQIWTFASGLRGDFAAVNAALTTPWSNGQVEGQVNRLKLIKRQMSG
jgi:transposase